MMIDQYLERIDEVVNNGNQREAELLLVEIVSVFIKDIPNIENGTSYLYSKDNMVLNMNEPIEPLSEECDCVSDLKLIKSKLLNYRDKLEMNKPAPTVTNNTNVNISNSKVSNSSIASPSGHKPRKKVILITVVSVVASIATIVAAVFTILSYINKA